MSNSAGSGAILAADAMRPGSSVEGTVAIANTGDLDGQLTVTGSALADAPGPAGSPLSERLRLSIDDVTDGAAAVRVHSGPLAELRSVPVGAFPAGRVRRFRFVATLPAGAGDDAYQGSRASVSFDWTATGGSPDAGIGGGPRRGDAVLRIPRRQRPLRDGAISLVTRCHSPCTARVALSLDARARARRIVGRATTSLPAGRARVRVRLSRRALTRIRNRLAVGGSVRGRITLRIDEQSGRRLRATRSIRFVLVR